MKDFKPEISVIIPVYRESGIVNLLDHLKKNSAGHFIEIIVADGDADGNTITSISDPDIITLISPKGRAAQMNRGASIARSDVLLFLHADTFLPDNAFVHISKALEDPAYAGGAFDLGFDTTKFRFLLIAYMASIKHRITRVPFGDQAIFMRKKYFDLIGRFKEIPLMEDVDLMKRVKIIGWKIRILPCRVRTSGRKWLEEGWWHTVFRNWYIQILYLIGVSPVKLVRYYYKNNGS